MAGEKKKFSLAGLFFESDETQKAEIKDKKAEVQEQNIPKQSNPETTAPANIDTAVFKEMLTKAMEKANLEGVDYYEFKSSLKALESVISDEKTRFTSAFVTAGAMGLTLERLISTANHYIEVLREEERKFIGAVEAKNKADVEGKAAELLKMDTLIKEKIEMITKLTQEIESIKIEKEKSAAVIDESRRKITDSKNGFYSVFSVMSNGITEDINKMNDYLVKK